MRQNLLRMALALLVVCAIVPAGAEAAQGRDAAQATTAAMPEGWSAGPVHRWTGYHRAGGSRRVRELQRRLNRLGYRAGPVDGLFGPRTERATRPSARPALATTTPSGDQMRDCAAATSYPPPVEPAKLATTTQTPC